MNTFILFVFFLLFCVIIGLLCWNIYSQYLFSKKETELLNRLMSKSYAEYVALTPKVEEKKEETPKTTAPDLSEFEEDWSIPEGELK